MGAATGTETIADYGKVYLLTLYMKNKFGQDFIRELAKSKTQGIANSERHSSLGYY